MEHIACLSYGKDSIVIPELCLKHDLSLDRIVTVDVWATPTIPADMPKMVEWKAKADGIIYSRYGIRVEHIKAERSYEEYFYSTFRKGKREGVIYGFPYGMGAWCNSRLKLIPLSCFDNSGYVQYLGICADEPERVERTTGTNRVALPAALGYSQSDCYKLAKEINLLSPSYEDATRGGCWFCHNQSLDQLRKLRKNHPEYWRLLLKWDNDSPTSFKRDGQTVHDFDGRFALEDAGIITPSMNFKWKMLDDDIQLKLY